MVSFAEIARDALAHSKAHKRSYDDDVIRMEPLLARFRDRAADSVTPQELEQHLSQTAEDNEWAPATVNRYRALVSLVYRLAIESGKAKIRRFSWHCLRHTFASRLVMAGVDIRTVQELMGHKSITMTVRYSHLTPRHALAAVERLTGTDPVAPTDTTTSTEATEQIPGDAAYLY